MLRPWIITVTIAAALSLAACGDDGDDSRATTAPATTAATGNADRYCALTRELDAEGEKFFAGLGRDATPKQFEAAERRFLERHADDLAELRGAAPAEIKADVEKLLAGMQERAGMEPDVAVTEARSSAAETRIRAFEKRNCGR